MEQFLEMLAGLHPVIPVVLAVLGSLVLIGQAYVAITPSQDDDAWFAKLEAVPLLGTLLKALKSFAPIQRKDQK